LCQPGQGFVAEDRLRELQNAAIRQRKLVPFKIARFWRNDLWVRLAQFAGAAEIDESAQNRVDEARRLRPHS
jgi:hypothetical protein